MRRLPALPALLAQLAASIAAVSGCSTSKGSCDGYDYKQKDIVVTPDVACSIAEQGGVTRTSQFYAGLSGLACSDACGPGFGLCDLPKDYAQAYWTALPGSDDAGADAGAKSCPAIAGTVGVHCTSIPCEGRRTAGVDEPIASNAPGLGAYFAACSYLEAVSVHAFARLQLELATHGAPDELLVLARQASLEEMRHAALTRELAYRFGVEPEVPPPPPPGVRSLFEVALENAVEGCVRETYGAVVGCFRARRAKDASVRAAMETIARDECEHADLAFRIAEWITPRLSVEQRAAVEVAMRAAMDELVELGGEALDGDERATCGLPGLEERRALALLVDREVVCRAARLV